MISSYFKNLYEVVENYSHIISHSTITEKVYSSEKGFIGGKLSFIDESYLHFAEVKSIKIVSKIKYRYHYQKSNEEIVFRYDNSRHHPDVKTFPHHKHSPGEILPSTEPDLEMILKEIQEIILLSRHVQKT
jgi:hypothetical protein